MCCKHTSVCDVIATAFRVAGSMILKPDGSSPSDITGTRSEAVHGITFQTDYDNAVVMLKQ